MGLLCVFLNTAVRAWALYGSWFFLDDFILLRQARAVDVSPHSVLTPYNNHLMPGGRLIVFWMASAGPLDWGLTATTTLALKCLSALAALWALVVLFGRRWAVLIPLNLYLWSALTVPAMMWWAAALNLVPQELSFWVAVGAWVKHLRSRSWTWLIITLGAVAFGLFFDVKAILTVAVLAFVAVAYFSEGPPVARVIRLIRRYVWSAVAFLVMSSLYLFVYRSRVDSPFRDVGPSIVADLAQNMIGSAFATAAIGGPWAWTAEPAPAVYADAPPWAQHLAWVVLAGVLAIGWLTRMRTLRAWTLLVCYVLTLLAILATSRGSIFGPALGGEYRYLNDAAPVLALCVGLAFLTVAGAANSSAPRVHPLLLVDLRGVTTAVAVLACLGSLVSTVRYVHIWHTDNASEPWFDTLGKDLAAQGRVDLADTTVPDPVMSQLSAPANTVADLAPLLSADVSFPRVSPALLVVGDDGGLQRAAIELGIASQDGPRPGCGWLVRDHGEDIPLAGQAFEWSWWLRIGYLAAQDSPVTVVAGDSRVETSVSAGLNDLFVRVEGSFDAVRLEGLDPGASMCVDTIEAGQPVPGGGLG